MVVLNDKDVRQKTGAILEQKSNLMGEETGMDKKWTLHVENFAKIKSADVTIAPLMCFVGDNNSGKSYLMSILWGILTLGKDIFPKKPSEAKAYKQCESWLKEHLNTETALTDDAIDLYITWFNELLSTQKKALVKKIFNYEVEIEKLKITHYERNHPIKIVWDASASRYSVTGGYIKFPEVEAANREELLRMNAYICWNLLMEGIAAPLVYAGRKGQTEWGTNLLTGIKNRIYAHVCPVD